MNQDIYDRLLALWRDTERGELALHVVLHLTAAHYRAGTIRDFAKAVARVGSVASVTMATVVEGGREFVRGEIPILNERNLPGSAGDELAAEALTEWVN